MIRRVDRIVRRPLALASLFVLAGMLACGSTEPRSIPIEQTTFADTLHVDLARSVKLASGMYVRDSVVGTGAVVAMGTSVDVRYAGYLANGTRFDENAPPRALLTFTVGSGRVIPGFEIGVQGMKVGGTRQLIIPPELGYGAAGVQSIPPYAVLVFVVDMVNAR